MAGERRLTSIKQLVNDMVFNTDTTISGTITIDAITGTVTVQLLEPVTIDGNIGITTLPPIAISSMPALSTAITSIPALSGTFAISIIGGTVATNTNITNNPLSVNLTTVPGTPTQTTTLISNASVTILAPNASRKRVTFYNWSNATSAPIFIHLAASAATTTNGQPIVAGESYTPPLTYTGEVRAISSTAANKELYIEEWV